MSGNIFTVTTNTKMTVPADFETAITATGFGKFNFLFLLLILASGWAATLESSTMAYVFPAAQCDLDLSLEDKGLLNAITYSGMISSAVIWGFLFDTLGRRKLLMIGFFLDFICVVISSLSQNKEVLIASKFFGGFIMNGPYAALSTYVSEFHSNNYRGRMQLMIAMSFCCGGIVLPLLAWGILPQELNLQISNTFTIYSWNILLFLCSIPSLVSAIIFVFVPESPKFLMTIGENEKALKIFQKIYAKNSGQPPKTFPITELVDEVSLKKKDPNEHGGQVTAKRSQSQALQEGWQQVKPLFFPPHLKNIILVCLIQTLFTMTVNTMRLWLPQIFQALNDYQYYYNVSSADLCESLEMIKSSNVTSDECQVNSDNSSVYINALIVAVVTLVGDLGASSLINKVGKKTLLFVLGILAGGFEITMYFSMNTAFAVAFSSLFATFTHIAANVCIVVIINLFPTTLRTMSLALALMCGRIGSMVGNLVFPLLIRTGCGPPFFTIAALVFACAFLSLLLPNTDSKALE
ncbi:synaptic vesicle glycoprotein 2C-like [Tribolium castaneum]|nr:PREDICTED: synaptic vesicle glycoprotein 2C-like [Tribolium castaneum]|eukprot:XP_008201263.1 PREDICTED: synaptic vesicle glycoprotein 2C-like [Tribolium castaneum]